MKYLLIVFCLVLCSCKHSEPDGSCIPLKLSKEKLLFNAEGGIDSITMGGKYWLTYDGTGCEYIGAEKPDYCNNNYCKNNGNISSNLIMKVECSWFNVTQIDEYTLFVYVNKNETEKEKKQYVSVQGGDCYSGFWVSQSAE
jgi:hypothetical protein